MNDDYQSFGSPADVAPMPGVSREGGLNADEYGGMGAGGYDERPEDLMSSFVPPDPTHFKWTHRKAKGSDLRKVR